MCVGEGNDLFFCFHNHSFFNSKNDASSTNNSLKEKQTHKKKRRSNTKAFSGRNISIVR